MRSAIFGPGESRPTAAVLEALPVTWMTAACLCAGFRRTAGWLGCAPCASAPRAFTCRVANRPGVFGVWPTEADAARGEAGFLLLYLPGDDDPILDRVALDAAILALRPGTAAAFRDFPAHPELAAACAIGSFRIGLAGQDLALALTAETRRRIVRPEGLAREGGGWLVPPGGAEEDLPAFELARDLFRVLAAGVSAATETSPHPPRRVSAPAALRARQANGALAAIPGDGGDCVTEVLAWGTAAALWPEASAPADVAPYAVCAAEPDAATLPELYVLTGFLGAGKTTFLNQFIEFHAAQHRLVAVIQNELGETGVDTHLLEGERSVLTMDAGCVCCSLAGHLAAGLRRLARGLSPEIVVLETTGLANPLNLREELAEIGDLARLAGVVAVADAERFAETLATSEIAAAQIAAADVVVLNKCDLVDAAAQAEVAAEIRRRNPRARLIAADHGRVPPAALGTLPAAPPPAHRHHHHDHHHDHDHDHHHHHVTHGEEGFSALRFDLAARIDRAALFAALAASPPGVMRIKGLARLADAPQPVVVQYVPGRAALEAPRKPAAEPPFVLIIGRDLDAAALRRVWRGLVKEPCDALD